MLITFKTDSYPNITMFENDALAMLKMMGHSATVPGSIRAEDVSKALVLLDSSLKQDKALPPADPGDAEQPFVSTTHRAMPLIELLTAAVKVNDYVMWDKNQHL